MKPTPCPNCGCQHPAPEETDDDYFSALSPEEYLNLNFGPGSWVRDPYDDKFIVRDYRYSGPGVAYIVVDRALRRAPTVIAASRIN
jgi:hypothetical protein